MRSAIRSAIALAGECIERRSWTAIQFCHPIIWATFRLAMVERYINAKILELGRDPRSVFREFWRGNGAPCRFLPGALCLEQ